MDAVALAPLPDAGVLVDRNSLFRTADRIAAEKRYLAGKWKAHIRLETYKSQDRVAMDAPRRQPVKL